MDSYLEKVVYFINREDGQQLSVLLEFDNVNLAKIKGRVERNLPPLWADLISAHLKVVKNFDNGEMEAAFNEQITVVQILQRIVVNSTLWILPVMYSLNSSLWRLALKNGEPAQQEAARLVNKSVTICLTDRQSISESRKWGAYKLMALLFKIYFRLDQLNLCGNVLRAVGAANLPDSNLFPKAHLVEFRYLLGRYYFVNAEYTKSEVELGLAFKQCPVNSSHNKRLILHYLIPLRIMLCGLKPSNRLLTTYGLDRSFYIPALKALRLGDLCKYQAIISENEPVLLRLGTFMLWEKLILLAWRNFVRRVSLLLGSASRVPIPSVQVLLKTMGVKLSIDEIACYIANLIDRNLIKGYISQEKAILVTSQKDPFPILFTNLQK